MHHSQQRLRSTPPPRSSSSSQERWLPSSHTERDASWALCPKDQTCIDSLNLHSNHRKCCTHSLHLMVVKSNQEPLSPPCSCSCRVGQLQRLCPKPLRFLLNFINLCGGTFAACMLECFSLYSSTVSDLVALTNSYLLDSLCCPCLPSLLRVIRMGA